MKILIADDSTMLRDRVKELILSLDFVDKIYEVDNSLEARKILNKNIVEVAIIDVRMPGGSGIELIQYLKEKKTPPKIIIFTNYPYQQYKEKALEKGADYFLSKSDEFDKLAAILKEIENKKCN
ncbi:MAG: response regulator [Melioribacteraceae bacterium]|nr:response regulator [Melioribacteraceae bacterium]MCF8395828.1 response regulator [Melioribacteraceae bacterium]MCF8420922.1 response regulator [Melioribacteraceae bacterium]